MELARYSNFLPQNNPHVHKYSRGRVAVIGGSGKYPGAVMLASKAVARAGAGYVTAFVPICIRTIFQSSLPEIVSVPIPNNTESFIEKNAFECISLEKQHCVLYGPGVGSGKTQTKLLKKLINADTPLVVDADMIEALASLEDINGAKSVYGRTTPLIITPHHGELKKWLRDNREDDYNKLDPSLIAFRVQGKLKAAEANNVVVVAKGEKTQVITSTSVLNPAGGTDTLATAGTGDVLAGTIAGLIAQSRPTSVSETANVCAAAVEAHALAGEIASKQFGRRGAMANNVCDCIGLAIDQLHGKEE